MNLSSHVYLALLAHAATEGVRTGRIEPAAANSNLMKPHKKFLFDASLGAIPIRVSVGDWRFDEARIAVVGWPTPEADEWINCMTARAVAGDVTAIGYLERRDGRLMLSSPLDPPVFFQKHREAALLALPLPSDASDPLQLYPRYLRFGSVT